MRRSGCFDALRIELGMSDTGIQSAKKPAVSQTFLTAGMRWLAYILAGISRKSIAIRALSVLTFVTASTAFAATPPTPITGTEVSLPSSANNRLFVGNAPDDGSV